MSALSVIAISKLKMNNTAVIDSITFHPSSSSWISCRELSLAIPFFCTEHERTIFLKKLPVMKFLRKKKKKDNFSTLKENLLWICNHIFVRVCRTITSSLLTFLIFFQMAANCRLERMGAEVKSKFLSIFAQIAFHFS